MMRRKALLGSLGADAAAADTVAAVAAAAAADPQRRGYHVYRGVCSAGDGEGWGLESFQTWGPGLRFAPVPLAGRERVSVCVWLIASRSDLARSRRTSPTALHLPMLKHCMPRPGTPVTRSTTVVLYRTHGDVRVACRPYGVYHTPWTDFQSSCTPHREAFQPPEMAASERSSRGDLPDNVSVGRWNRARCGVAGLQECSQSLWY